VVADKKELRRGYGPLDLPERKSLVFSFRGPKRRDENRTGGWES